jgi:hypothetical protein
MGLNDGFENFIPNSEIETIITGFIFMMVIMEFCSRNPFCKKISTPKIRKDIGL